MIINVPINTKIAVVGDIHEHNEQFSQLADQINPGENMWLISVGDVVDKGFGESAFNEVTRRLMDLNKIGVGYAVKGNHEIKAIKNAKKIGKLSKELQWWKDRPTCLRFKFPNGHFVTVVHAGVCPYMELSDLYTDFTVCYVRDVDQDGKMIPLIWRDDAGKKKLVAAREGKAWHDSYDGKFGYIVSGHAAQKDGEAKYYGYSCNIDSAVFDTGKLTCQVFNNNGGLDDKIVVTGKAFKPNI